MSQRGGGTFWLFIRANTAKKNACEACKKKHARIDFKGANRFFLREANTHLRFCVFPRVKRWLLHPEPARELISTLFTDNPSANDTSPPRVTWLLELPPFTLQTVFCSSFGWSGEKAKTESARGEEPRAPDASGCQRAEFDCHTTFGLESGKVLG